MKDVLNNLRKRDRLNVVPLNYTYSGFKDHLYMVTAKKANFMKKDETLEALNRRKEYPNAQKAFFQEIETAEKTLLKQYYATRPELQAAYINTMRQKAKSRRGLLNFRKRKVKEAEVLAEQKNAERKKLLEDNKKGLVVSKSGEVVAKDQKSTQGRKIALEIRRVAGERKSIALMHAQMVAKGQRKTIPRQRLAKEREKAGPLGTPERDAFEEKLAKKRAQQAKVLKKWREKRALSRAAKARAQAQEKPSEQVAQDLVVQQAFQQQEVTAAPPSQFREAATNKLKASRELEKEKAERKDKPGKAKKATPSQASKTTNAAAQTTKKPLTPAQRQNQAKQKRQVKKLEEKLKQKAK